MIQVYYGVYLLGFVDNSWKLLGGEKWQFPEIYYKDVFYEVSDDGQVFVSGRFSEGIGGDKTTFKSQRIAVWNGSDWTTMGTGIRNGGYVSSLTYGHKAEGILDAATRHAELGQTLCECEQVLAAEVEYAVRKEWVTSLADLRRRTRLGNGSCQGCRCLRNAACFLGSTQMEFGRSRSADCRQHAAVSADTYLAGAAQATRLRARFAVLWGNRWLRPPIVSTQLSSGAGAA